MRFASKYRDFKVWMPNLVAKLLDRRPSVLVLHDIDGWALDHVFDLWFSGVQSIKIVRANWMGCSTSRAFQGFDAVVFGYLDIYLRFGFDPDRSIVVIHDPCELFPQIPDWKNARPDSKRMQVLKALRSVIVISKEMESILASHGIKTWLIPTMSRLPTIEEESILTSEPIAVSIFKDYPRKNSGLLRCLAKKGQESGKWNLRLFENPDFNDLEYLQIIDRSPIYVCTSWQEGGPLPAMDVMSRGGVVVSAPVGQVQEMITHGESGFICRNELEFYEALSALFSDRHLFQTMRRNSFDVYKIFRNKNAIASEACRTLEAILQTSCSKN